MAGRTRLGWLLVGLVFLCSGIALAATTWYVSPGDDIQGVINSAAAGDTVVFAPGTYNLIATISVTKPLTILGAQANVDPRPSAGGRTGPETLLKSSTTVFDIQAHHVVINGFSIQANISNANTNIIQDNSTSFASQNATVAYNIITNTGSTMNEAVKIRVGESPVIAYNYIYNIPSPGDAINFDRVTNGRIEYNEIFNSGSENAAIYVYNSTGTQILWNIVDTTTQNDGIKLGAKDGTDASKSGGVIAFNIVRNTAQDGITVYMSGVVIEGNAVTGSTSENGAIYVSYNVRNVTITGNYIADNGVSGDGRTTYAIRLGKQSYYPTDITVRYNTVVGNEQGLFYNHVAGADTLDATGNWWGSVSGPGAGTISTNVAYSPWLGNDPSEPVWTFIVARVGPEPTPGYIQRAVDLARDGDVVFVQAGTYVENVEVYKPLFLIGDDATISPTAGAAITLRSPGGEALEDVLISISTSGGAYGVLIDGGLWAHIPGEDVVIENLTLTGASLSSHGQEGLVITNGAQVTGLFVVDSDFLLNRVGLGISGAGTTVADASVTSSWFIGNTLHGIQILAGAAVDGLLVDGSLFLFSGNEGINISGGAQVDDLVVRDSWFSLNKIGIGVSGTATHVHGLTVENSSFVGQHEHGIYIHGATVSDLGIHDTLFTGSGYQGIHIQNATVDGATIAGSEFTSNQWGLLIRGTSNVTDLHVVGNIFSDHSETALGLSSGSVTGALIEGNTFVNSGWEHIDVGLYWMGALTASDIQILRNLFGPGAQWAAVYVDRAAVFGPSDVVAHYNAFSTGAWGVFNANAVTVNAALNWWGDPEGPTHTSNPDGAGDAVTDNVIYSPWLGTDPDGDPAQPGVQIMGPVLIIVAPVGPEPTGGYLNTAIAGANTLPFADTIQVRHGTYDASTPITGPVTLISQVGSASHTTLTGPMSLRSGGILVGLPLRGFTIMGDVTVEELVDAASSRINWCNVDGTVTNKGTGTFDARYNYWGTQVYAVIDARTIGDIAVDPYLPWNADDSYRDIVALFTAGVAGDVDRAIDQLWAMARLGQDVNTFVQYLGVAGAGALGGPPPGAQIGAGFAGTILEEEVAGGAAGLDYVVDGVVVVGDAIGGHFTLTDPVTGQPIAKAVVTLSLLDEDGKLAFWGAATYDPATGEYVFTIDTSRLAPGTYQLIIQAVDGQSATLTIEILAA